MKKNGQSRKTDNIEQTRHRTKTQHRKHTGAIRTPPKTEVESSVHEE
jgi:hypothetical protein